MRKTFVTALIALLVMLAVSCDNVNTGQNDDGLVTLNVNTGGTAGSRSITDTQAKDTADYVEVIFKSGSDYYRANGYQGANLKVKVPAGTYDNSNTLILIGKKSDGTLLAFGTATTTVTVGPGEAPDPTITLSASSIETNISAGTGTDFVITNTNIVAVNPAFTTTVVNNGVFFDGTTACFQVPTGVVATTYPDGIEVTLGLTNADFSTLGDRIKVQSSANPVKFTPIGSSPPINPITGSVKPTTDLSAGEIEFAFNTTTTEGKYAITFDFPVVGYSLAWSAGKGSQPLTWHIKAGTEPSYDFGGDTAENETVPLIVVNNPTEPTFGIIVKPGH